MDCKVRAIGMELDDSEPDWLAAIRARVIDKQGQRHDEFLSRYANLRTLKRVPLDCKDHCKDLGRLAMTSNRAKACAAPGSMSRDRYASVQSHYAATSITDYPNR